jgi:hypothetical protein
MTKQGRIDTRLFRRPGMRNRPEPPLTKTQGRGIRHCCRRSDCDKCFRTIEGLGGHMSWHERGHLRTPIVHGTVGGYRRENRRGIPTCDLCRHAWTEYLRERKPDKEALTWNNEPLIFVDGEWIHLDD